MARIPLAALTAGVNWVCEREFLVFLDAGGQLRATRNSCRHQQGRFGDKDGCIVTCARHGWQLDLSRMVYVNPTNEQTQPELRVERVGDQLELYEPVGRPPWETGPPLGPPQALTAGELTFRFLAHACGEFTFGNKRLVTDPWLLGPAFLRGWWAGASTAR